MCAAVALRPSELNVNCPSQRLLLIDANKGKAIRREDKVLMGG